MKAAIAKWSPRRVEALVLHVHLLEVRLKRLEDIEILRRENMRDDIHDFLAKYGKPRAASKPKRKREGR